MKMNLPEAGDLPIEEIPPALSQLAALQGQLAARLIMERIAPVDGKAEQAPDELINIKAAAELLAVDAEWIYRRIKKLPFVRRLSARCLRFSKQGLLAWRDRQKR